MPKWLMVLIAAACLVVCAAGANYVWGGWQEKQQAAERLAAVFEYLNAKPGDVETATKTCKKVQFNLKSAQDLNWNDETIAYAQKMIAVCETNGFL